ncbi:hypothetical protein PybrP1_005122 [[Pythium] brassicae (nom. inval.)]|nr:hypothetical protein PybrP1_005122 [[Pythium] brassicae (nom. inval.)]
MFLDDAFRGNLRDAEAAAWRQRMSSFSLNPVVATTAAAAVDASRSLQAPRRPTPPLLHRSSDPHVSDQDLHDVVDMSEHARWANLGEPVYAEKDLEIFRPPSQQSTLPVYYAKAWLPYAADTVFNALFDARYRLRWDARNVRQLFVVDRRRDGDVMYCAQSLSWPFANRDYVYHRRTRFFAPQHSFVVVCQAMHHSSAPPCNGLVRVETYALRLCIRSTGTSSCDVYVEYEDDTDFSIPNYIISLLLATSVPSFMHDLRAACAAYASYLKTLSDSGVESIPSQVVRRRSDAALVATSTLGPSQANHATSASDALSKASDSAASSTAAFKHKRRALARRRRGKSSDQSDDDAPSEEGKGDSGGGRSLRLRLLLRSKAAREATKKSKKLLLKKTSSTGSLHSSAAMPSPSSSVFSEQEPSSDDFVIAFYKQKIGLHLETDLFSNRVLVAHCEKESEAARASVCIEPGVLVTSVNGHAVAALSFTEIMHEIKTSLRPLALGFTLPDKENSKTYRRFKAPTNVLKCFVARDEHDLVHALRPLNEDASLSAVLKADFLAPAYSKRRTRALVSASSRERDATVLVPEGFLVYEIDDCFVLDLAFAEIAHLLRRNNEPRVVTFKAAVAVESDRLVQQATRSALSKRLSGVFKWRSYSSDDTGTASSSAGSSPFAKSARQRAARQLSDDATGFAGYCQQAPEADAGSFAKTLVTTPAADSQDVKWGDASPGACLPDYSGVAITSANLAWAWEHVHLLKADERIFSAALLIRKLEAFLMRDGSSCATDAAVSAKTILNAMHEERDFVQRVKERNAQGVQALREFNCEADTDWQFGQTYVGVTTHWKPGEDGTVWLKLDGLVEGVDIFNTVAVIRETDLYNVWVPFCNRSLLLQASGHVDVVAYMSVAFPLLQRDAVIQAFGINACYESRAILLLGKTVDEATLAPSVQAPKARGWNADRMEMRGFRALIEPVSRTRARVCIVANIDPKCPIPRSLLNFGIKKVAGILLYLVRKEAEKIEQAQRDGGADNEHLQRIERDPTHFYAWLRPLMDTWFDDQRCSLLPPPLPLASPESDGVADENERVQQERRLLGRRRMLIDYLYDFGIWPYVLMFIFSQVTAETGFLQVCALKLVFTCTCTWFGVPGAFSWRTRRLKRARDELDPLRRRCVVFAGLCDVLNSWFLRVWAHWFVCYLPAVVHQFVLLVEHQQRLLARQQQQLPDGSLRGCFDRSPLEVRESENFWLIGSAFFFATVVVAIQIAVNI